MQNNGSVNFKGYMFGKMVYEVAGKTKTRITPKGVWMCNKGNDTLVRKINKLAKDKNSGNDIMTISQEIVDNEKNLVFEIPKDLFFKTNSFIRNLLNDINSEPLQRKFLENKNIKTIIFKLPKSHLESLKKCGADYDLPKRGAILNPIKYVTNSRLKKRLSGFVENITAHFKSAEEKAWLNDFFANIV